MEDTFTSPVSADLPEDQECAEFQAKMADRIGAGEDLHSYPHMQTCDRCRGLVGELEFIAEFAHKLFPRELEPREDLWDDFVKRLEKNEPEGDEGLAHAGA